MTAPSIDTRRPYRPITADDERRVRDLAAQRLSDSVIAALLGEDLGRIKSIRCACGIPAGGRAGRQANDPIAIALASLLDEEDREAVRRHVISLIDRRGPDLSPGTIRFVDGDFAPQEQAA